MAYKVVITGTTGMVGKGVLLECMDHPEIHKILIVNRKSLGIEHPKVEEVILEDFFKISDISASLKGYDACFFCLGVSSIGQSEEAFNKVTFELTTLFAESFIQQSPNSIFCYVSGTGTDSTEQGRIMWARVKGKTENAILAMPFKKAYMFRPGYIQPLRGIKSKTNWYQALYNVFWPIYLILKHFPSTATNTTNMGLAMINTLDGNYENTILENKEINQISSVKNGH